MHHDRERTGASRATMRPRAVQLGVAYLDDNLGPPLPAATDMDALGSHEDLRSLERALRVARLGSELLEPLRGHLAAGFAEHRSGATDGSTRSIPIDSADSE
jgi:hypothetical protein